MTKRFSSCLIQSNYGQRGNFELVTDATNSDGFVHWWRNNDDPHLPWASTGVYLRGIGFHSPVLIEDDLGTPGSLQMVAMINFEGGTQIGRFLRQQSGAGWDWDQPVHFHLLEGSDVNSGRPVFIQSDRVRGGSYDVFATQTQAGLCHFLCDQTAFDAAWTPYPFWPTLGLVDDLAFVETRRGRFELLLRRGTELSATWKEKNGSATSWAIPHVLFDRAAGRPAMIQSTFGRHGNLEVLTLDQRGAVWHFWRNNDHPINAVWSAPVQVVDPPDDVSAAGDDDLVALIQSNRGAHRHGNFEVVYRVAGRNYHLWREHAPPWRWHGLGQTTHQALPKPKFFGSDPAP